MSSHREAPEISKDPVADNTDLYAFVSPDAPDTVTIIANYIPLEDPAGGPNFFNFGDDVLYEINIDNDGDGVENVVYQFTFNTLIGNPKTFLYNTGPISSLSDKNWNLRQQYTVTRRPQQGRRQVEPGCDQPRVPAGAHRPPLDAELPGAGDGRGAGPGQRRQGLRRTARRGLLRRPRLDLRPRHLRPVQNLHLVPSAAAMGRDGTKDFNVHSIAIQLPKAMVTKPGGAAGDATQVRRRHRCVGDGQSPRSTMRDAKSNDDTPAVAGSRSRAWATR